MKKRILSLGLASVLVLGSGTAFAADEDLRNKTTGELNPLVDVLFDQDKLFEVAFDQENYTIEMNNKLYSLKDVQSKFDVNPDIKIEDAISDLTPVGDVDPEESLLKVVEVSAINNTSVVVEFDDVIDGEVKVGDFTFDNGLTVVAVDKLSGGKRVKLTTDKQVEGTNYEVSYKGEKTGKTFLGQSAEYENAFEIKSARSRSNTSVIVTLSDAPLVQLNKEDFDIVGLDILSVQATEGIVTLTTSPQVAGREYTITGLRGTGTATFTGAEAVETDAVIKDVKVDSLRELRVEFNDRIVMDTAVDPANYYIGMTKQETTDLQAASLETLAKDNWKIVPFGKGVDAVCLTAKTNEVGDDISGYAGEGWYAILETEIETVNGKEIEVITKVAAGKDVRVDGVVIQSTAGALITDEKEGLGLTENELVTLEFRNLKRGYINSEAFEFLVKDDVRPNLLRATKTLTRDKKTGTTSDLVITFDEPMNKKDAKINKTTQAYINGKKVDLVVVNDGESVADASKLVVLNEGENKTFIDNLKLGKHTLSIGGAEDLAGNLQNQNYEDIEFEIVEKKDPEEAEAVKPVIESVEQIADNALMIGFNISADKVSFDATSGSGITVKAGLYNGDEENTRVDLNVNESIVDYTKGGKTYKIVILEDGKNKDVLDKLYAGQNQVKRTIEISGYKNIDKNGDKAGDKFVKTNFVLKRDTKAPEIVRDEVLAYYKADGTAGKQKEQKLVIPFEDGIFGEPNGKITLNTSSSSITIERTDIDGKSYRAEVKVEDAQVANITYEADGTVKLGTLSNDGLGNAIAIDVSNVEGMLEKVANDDMRFVDGEIYEVTFSKGSVTDATETVNGKALINGEVNAIDKTKVSITARVSEKAEEGKVEGRVPQTAVGLIKSNSDSENTIVSKVSEAVKIDKDGSNQIVVVFDGEVLPETARDRNNYRLDRKVLPKESIIKLYEGKTSVFTTAEIKASIDDKDNRDENSKTAYVVITLPKGTTKYSANYDFEVSGITNEAGKMMLPVATKVYQEDDTAPKVRAIDTTGSTEVTVEFDEDVVITDASVDNFEVTVKGKKYKPTLVKHHKETASGDKIPNVLSLSLNILEDDEITDLKGEKVTVEIKKDKDGNMNITDESVIENEVEAGTFSN